MQYIYSLFSGHPDAEFVETLRRRSKAHDTVIYLSYSQDDTKKLLSSDLFFHDCPSADELIQKNVLRGTRKQLYLAYEEDYAKQLILDMVSNTLKYISNTPFTLFIRNRRGKLDQRSASLQLLPSTSMYVLSIPIYFNIIHVNFCF